MNKLYILLGSNMGNSKQQFVLAKKLLRKKLGTILRESDLYQTAAWGNNDQPDFLNQVVILGTNKSPADSMNIILHIEQDMGRIRTKKNAPRIIDIDILYFNKDVLNLPGLIVPHPAIAQRRFVLTPLNELSPRYVHPVLHKDNHQLLKICKDPLDVKKIV